MTALSREQIDDRRRQFWSIFSAAMNENPPPAAQIEAVLPAFKYLAIELSRQWKPEDVNPLILAQMKKAAQQIGPLALGTHAACRHAEERLARSYEILRGWGEVGGLRLRVQPPCGR